MVKQSKKKKRTSKVKKTMRGGKMLKRKKSAKVIRTEGSRYPEAHLNLRINNYLSTKPRAYKLFVCYGKLMDSNFKDYSYDHRRVNQNYNELRRNFLMTKEIQIINRQVVLMETHITELPRKYILDEHRKGELNMKD